MVADQVKKRVGAGKWAGAEDRVRVTTGRWLFDELDPLHQVAGRSRVGSSIAGGDDQARLLNRRCEYLFQQNAEDWFLDPVAVDQHLQRQRTLVNTGGGDDGFANIHGLSRRSGALPIVSCFAPGKRTENGGT
jgi:hypothetical protein